jgi:hypothetical protein
MASASLLRVRRMFDVEKVNRDMVAALGVDDARAEGSLDETPAARAFASPR